MKKLNLDVRGFACPMPVIKTKNMLEENDGSLSLEVIVDNDVAVQNVTKFAKSQNLEVTSEKIGDDFKLIINRDNSNENGEYQISKQNDKLELKALQSSSNGAQTILITTDKLGKGNDELGAILMKSFIFSLKESKPIPQKLIFLNSGVNLTTTNKEAIENLKIMQENGTQIVSCGTCLDFYNLKDQVKVGTIGNMYDIVDSLNQAINKFVI